MISDAEASYSQKRVDSLQEEWSSVYPQVVDYLDVLTRKPASFPASELSKGALEEWITGTLLAQDETKDPVARVASAHFISGRGSFFEFVLVLLDALYIVGAVGIKPDSTSTVYWAQYSDHRPAAGSIRPNSVIHIHPTFWRALGVRP